MKRKRLVKVTPARPIPVIAHEDRAFEAIRGIYANRRQRAERWQRMRFVVEWGIVAFLLAGGIWWWWSSDTRTAPATTLPIWEELHDETR